MFDLIKECVGDDGIGRMSAWISYTEDKNGLAWGNSISLESNYKNNSYLIKKIVYNHGVPVDLKKITSGKDETLSEVEFRKWLISNNYKDAFSDYQKITSQY